MVTNKFDATWPANFVASESLPGIKNNDSTCQGSSLFQVFNHTPALINYLKNHSCANIWKDYISSLEECLPKRRKKKKRPIDADCVLQSMMEGSKDLVFGRFNDTSELLMHVIDRMPEDQSFLKDIFCCENTTVHRCKHCGNEWSLETCQHVRVSVGRTLTEVLAEMCREKDAEGQRTCDKCEVRRDCTEKFVINESPPVLGIRLATSHDAYDTNHEKTCFPETVNIRPYMNDKTGNAVLYKLYAVVVFIPGHYYAHCRAPSGQWNTYNDSDVDEVSLEEVLSCTASSLYYQRSPELDSTWDKTNLKQEERMIESFKKM